MTYNEGHNQFDNMGGVRLAKKKKKKKTKRRIRKAELEDPSLREHLLAGAYGGVAKPKPKRQGVKYTTDINAGLRDIATPNAMRLDQSRRNFGHGSLSGLEGAFDSGRKMSRPAHRGMGGQSSYGRSEKGSNLGSRIGARGGAESVSHLMDPQQREARLKE